MTVLIVERRRAAQFAELVDAPPGDARRTTHDPVVGPMLRVARSLRPVPDAGPSEEFRAALRSRLLDPAATTAPAAPLSDVPAARSGRRRFAMPSYDVSRRRVVAALAGVTLVAGATGTAFASAGARPGDLLYPVKRGIEDLRVVLSLNDGARADRYLDNAGHRLAELEALLPASGPAGRVADVRAAATGLTSALRDGSSTELDRHAGTGDTAPLTDLDAFLRDASPRLHALAPRVPRGAAPDLAAVTAYVDQLQQRVATLLDRVPTASPVPASTPAPSPPGGVVTAPRATRGGAATGSIAPRAPTVAPRRAATPRPAAPLPQLPAPTAAAPDGPGGVPVPEVDVTAAPPLPSASSPEVPLPLPSVSTSVTVPGVGGVGGGAGSGGVTVNATPSAPLPGVGG